MTRVLLMAAGSAGLVVAVSLGQARSEATPLPGLPAYTAGYKAWPKVNRAPIPPRSTGDPHGGTKNVFASKKIRRGRYPVGTVIVKEITRPRARFVGMIAVMRKTRPSSAPNNGWQMIEYERASTGTRFGVLAQGRICFACHVQAKKNDYVFTKR